MVRNGYNKMQPERVFLDDPLIQNDDDDDDDASRTV